MTVSCELNILATPQFILPSVIATVFEFFFFAMRIFLWCVYLGHCNFQKVLLNILLPYLSYLLPRCAVLCTKNKSGALWTHKRKMLSWVSLFIFLRWVYDLMPSFFIDSPLRGHNSL